MNVGTAANLQHLLDWCSPFSGSIVDLSEDLPATHQYIAMANGGGVVRFAQNQYTSFYMCRSCRNHLVKSHNSEVTVHRIHCENVVNVKAVNFEDTWYIHHDAVMKAACNQCNSGLGYIILSLNPRRVGREIVCYREESFLLDRDAMLFWNGHQVLYADTWEPVEDNANA